MNDPLYELPTGVRIPLEVAPQLASWMKGDHPDQVRLQHFLNHAEGLVRPMMTALGNDLALRLDVALPEGVNPLVERDLDNYLYPLVARLGSERFVSVWATKQMGGVTTICIEPARSTTLGRDWYRGSAQATQSSTSLAWKQQVHAQFESLDALPKGPAALQLSFEVGASRNWINLWKPAIDSLDPILGPTVPGRDWHPQDGRVVRLGLHRTTVASQGFSVGLGVRWRTAPLHWPELAWLSGMAPEEREAIIRSRQRDVRSGKAEAADDDRKDEVGHPSLGAYELADLAMFRAAISTEVMIVVTDKPTRREILHVRPRKCPWVQERWFVQKVLEGRRKHGAYYRVEDLEAAFHQWPSLKRCERCGWEARPATESGRGGSL